MTDKVKVDKGVLVGHETALEMQKIVEYFRINGLLGNDGRKSNELINGPAIYVRNDDASEAPPFACMQVVGTVEVGGQNYLKVDKPIDGDGTAGWFVFNGPNAIASGDFGIAFDGPLCRMLTDGSTVTAGELWGPVSGQWTVEPGGSLFVAAGEDDIATDVMRGFFRGGSTTLYKATMKSTWSAGVVSCDIYSINGVTFTDTGIDANVYDGLGIFSTLTTGDSMLVLLQSGKYYAIQAPCP